MENRYGMPLRQSGGLNVTPVTPIFKYKYNKICEIGDVIIN